MPINHKRSSAVVASRSAEKTERQNIRAFQADLQAIVDNIDGSTNLASLRGYVRDLARISRRMLRMVSGG